MNTKWVYGTSFPVLGKRNTVIETKAIQEDDGTWTAQVAHLVDTMIEKSTFFGGFDTRIEALQIANEIALSLAQGDEPKSGQWSGISVPSTTSDHPKIHTQNHLSKD